MNCPKCGMALPDDSEFCQFCGEKIAPPKSISDIPVETVEKKCPKCGLVLPGDSVFCHFCGEKITDQPIAGLFPQAFPPKKATAIANNTFPEKSAATINPESNQEPKKSTALFEDYPNTIQENIPVLLEKVSLYNDPQTGSLAASCMFRSLTDKPILAMLVNVYCTDVWGTTTDSVEGFQFLDLRTERGSVFGQDKSIPIPNSVTRFIEVDIKKVMFIDRTLAESGPNREVLPAQQPLVSFFGNEELKNEFIRETGVNAQSTVTEGGGYWRCACGAINTEKDNNCYHCNAAKDALLNHQNVALISSNLELYRKELAERAEKKRAEQEKYIRQAEERSRLAREEQERKSRAEAARLAEETHQKKEAHKKRVKQICIISAAILLTAILSYVTIWHVIPSIRYNNADTALKSAQYDAAFESFTALAGYKDSAEKAKEARYQKACSLINNGSFTDAVTEFTKIVNYKDSRDQIVYCENQTAYLEAKKLFESDKYLDAAEAFSRLGDFSDSAEQVNASNYQYAKQLLDDGSFEEAHVAFASLADYEDSKALADESYYQLATEYLEAKEYKNAYDFFGKVSRYKDSADLRNESCYQLATELFNKKKYKEAYSYYSKISAYKDSATMSKESRYCLALTLREKQNYKEAIDILESSTLKTYKDSATLLKNTQYLYAQQLEKAGKYSASMEYYKELGDYKDSKSKYLQTKYKYGKEKLKSKSYKDAVSIFKGLGNYEDSKEKLKEAKYGYVLAHRNNNDTTTYEYLKDLKSAGYQNSKDIYAELYNWSIELVCVNSNPDDYTTSLRSVDKYCDYLHFQFKLHGGTPGEKVTLKHRTVYPNGDVFYSDWYWEDKMDGNQFGVEWSNGVYSDPYHGTAGTLTVKIYDKKTGDYVGEASIRLT